MLGSQGMVLTTTAMVVSTTLLYLAFSKYSPSLNNNDASKPQNLRSCLSSGKKKEKKKKKMKKKMVQFAENVKDTKGNGEEYRREKERSLNCKQLQVKKKENSRIDQTSCRNQIHGIPANRIALYNGILRDRLHRIEC